MDRKEQAKKITARFLKAMNFIIKEKIQEVSAKRTFAHRLGLNPQDITLMERGTRYATLDNVYMLCTIFKIKTEWIILNSGSMQEEAIKEPDLSSRLERIERKIGLRSPVFKMAK